MVNKALLLETLEHIKNNPQQWRQEFWFINFDHNGKEIHSAITLNVEELNQCGSAFCFAGHAAIKRGAVPPKVDAPWHTGWRVNGEPVEDFAAAELGINHDQAGVLFDPDNTLEDLEKFVEVLIKYPNISSNEMLRAVGRYYDDYDGYDDDDEAW